jgi:hypothetical protein
VFSTNSTKPQTCPQFYICVHIHIQIDELSGSWVRPPQPCNGIGSSMVILPILQRSQNIPYAPRTADRIDSDLESFRFLLRCALQLEGESLERPFVPRMAGDRQGHHGLFQTLSARGFPVVSKHPAHSALQRPLAFRCFSWFRQTGPHWQQSLL